MSTKASEESSAPAAASTTTNAPDNADLLRPAPPAENEEDNLGAQASPNAFPLDSAASPLDPVDNFPINISWSGVEFSVGERQILRGFTGTARAGRVLAILGKSGSGKSTLCKLLADRLSTDGDRVYKGQFLVNEAPLTPKHRSLIAFLPQEDILNGLGNTEETLRFAARIRRGNLPEEETEHMVRNTLKELGLNKVKDTIIGIPGLTTGLSGGERKRASIGSEIVHNPKVLVLDEPTTGLDTVTSEKIVRMMRDFARRGRTVIAVLHQPTFECMRMFDDILLMAEGRAVYHGPMKEAVSYFSSIGFDCPADSTPTDYFMWHMEDEKSCPKLLKAWKDHLEKMEQGNYKNDAAADAAADGGDGDESSAGDSAAALSVQAPVPGCPDKVTTIDYLDQHFVGSDVPWTVQVVELFKRAFRNAMRNHMNIIATLVQSVIFAVYAGVLFVNLTDDVQGIQDRMGILFTMSVNTAFAGASAVINTFPAIKAVFLREQQAGAYSVLAFYLATFLADLPLQAVSMLLQCVIVYFTAGLVTSAPRFFNFFAAMLVAQQVSVSIGLALSAGTSNPVIAAALVPAIMTPFLLASSFLTSIDRLRPYWVWLERISFVKLPFVLLAHNEFEALGDISCDVERFGARFCSVQPKNGTAALTAFELDTPEDADWISWLTLCLILLVVRLMGWAALVRSSGQKE